MISHLDMPKFTLATVASLAREFARKLRAREAATWESVIALVNAVQVDGNEVSAAIYTYNKVKSHGGFEKLGEIVAQRDTTEQRHRAQDAESALQKAEHDAAELRAEINRLRNACSKQDGEICQILGKALGYPWFKDDQKNFPGATAENGVCVGEHVAELIADEAATEIGKLRSRRDEVTSAIGAIERGVDILEGLKNYVKIHRTPLAPPWPTKEPT